MNAIVMQQRVDELIDRTRTSRHSDSAYYNSINAAINKIVKDRIEAIRVDRKYGVQSSQRLREELNTLIPAPATGSLSSGNIPYPSNYLYYLIAYATVGTTKEICFPASYNTMNMIKKSPFHKPSATQLYFNEFVTGLKIISDSKDTVTTGTYELWYIKKPAVVSIGKLSQQITDGGTLSTGSTYYVYADSIYNAVTYLRGETFVAGGVTTLTSGIVIVSTNITNCDLPDHLHEEVCQLAAADLMQIADRFDKANMLKGDVERN